MRVRKKKNGQQRLDNCGDLIVYSRENLPQKPYQIEIGCGKGDFICEMAKRNPQTQFIAVEKVADVAMLAAEKVLRNKIENVHFIVCDAMQLTTFFDKGDVETIYLNFSDPWPKDRHCKRRLTYRSFLNVYKSLLKNDGSIIFKTDNRPLFDFSLEEMKLSGFILEGITYDLHNSELNKDNIQTEYERNFSAKGFSINRVQAILPASANISFRNATEEDIEFILPLFCQAREYLAKNNIDQWQDGYPQEEIIRDDISTGNGYVGILNKAVVSFAALCPGLEPSYESYSDKWLNNDNYYSLHRIAVDSTYKGLGIGGQMISFFTSICTKNGIYNLRSDTHTDNRSMRRLLEKNGFIHTGEITLNTGEPRVSYHKAINRP